MPAPALGVVAYVEQILQTSEAFAGLPAGRAEVPRRALSQGKTSVIEEIDREFLTAAEPVAGFQGSAFCRAHSTAYGV